MVCRISIFMYECSQKKKKKKKKTLYLAEKNSSLKNPLLLFYNFNKYSRTSIYLEYTIVSQ
ncbi:predicted protein [Escherichia albertii]|nr:predicted protein [Escherichia albertii]